MENLKPIDFEISYKPNPQLKVFNETIEEYRNWANRAVDRIGRNNYRWGEMLHYVQTWSYGNIKKVDLMNTNCDNVNAWLLSTKLYSWISDWLCKSLYERRTQLCGGRTEANNGFEL